MIPGEMYTHIIIRDRLHQGQVRSMTANDPIGCRDFVPHSIHLHATFCGTDNEKEWAMRFF